jgi:hypothetical protein
MDVGGRPIGLERYWLDMVSREVMMVDGDDGVCEK